MARRLLIAIPLLLMDACWTASPASEPTSRRAKPTRTQVVTVKQWKQAMLVAQMAARNEMHTLSLQAVRRALGGGQPVALMPIAQRGRVRIGSPAPRSDLQTLQRVQDDLTDLERFWRKGNVSADIVYETLADVVLPAGRPTEILAYGRPLDRRTVLEPRSVSWLLAYWAVRADRVDDLRRRIEQRIAHPAASLPGSVLLAQLGCLSDKPETTRQLLTSIEARLEADKLRTSNELACHAALPALRHNTTRAAAMAVLRRALDNLNADGNENLARLVLELARFEFDFGDPQQGKKRLDQYLQAMQPLNARYTGSRAAYGLYHRKQQLATVIAELARAGELDDALDIAHEFADIHFNTEKRLLLGGGIGLLVQQLSKLEPDQRYERLKKWMLPSNKRPSVSILASLTAIYNPPPIFFGNARSEDPIEFPDGVASFPSLLIESAKRVGKLDELVATLVEAKGKGLTNAELLLLLARLGQPEIKGLRDATAQYADSLQNQLSAHESGSWTIPWKEILVARAALHHPECADIGGTMLENVIDLMQRRGVTEMMTIARRDIAQQRAWRRQGRKIGPSPRLAHWIPASHTRMTSNESVHPFWIAHEGHVCQLTGAQEEFLYFAYPLTGNFTFTTEASRGEYREAQLAIACFTLEPHGAGSTSIWPAGGHERVTKPPFPFALQEGFSRVVLDVRPGKIRCLTNGRLYHEINDPSPTAPFLALMARREHLAVWRNLKITGSPIVPREVRLTHADRLDGWVCPFYGESQAYRNSVDENGVPVDTRHQEIHKLGYDWFAKEGVIHGRRATTIVGVEPIQSRLYYQRPMRNGEEIRFEFYYQPGKTEVHPALDRIAFLLQPAGVRLHWMTDGRDYDWTGLPSDNAVDVPNNPHGSRLLPLKSGDWNAVRVNLDGDVATIRLNGELACKHQFEPKDGRLFSLFHYKDQTEVRVRNVVLTGDWPETLSPALLDNLTQSVETNLTRSERLAHHAVIGEEVLVGAAHHVLDRARRLDRAERYEYLARWVLPSDDHDTFRLVGVWLPANWPRPTQPGDSVARQIGGTLASPAGELVQVAAQLGKLDELADRVVHYPADSNHAARSKSAFLAIIRLSQQADEQAAALITRLARLAEETSADTPRWQRWPELLVLLASQHRSKCHAVASTLSSVIEKQRLAAHAEGAAKFAGLDEWDRDVIYSRHRLAFADRLNKKPAPRAIEHFTPVAHETAQSHGEGRPRPSWVEDGNRIAYYPGHANDFLYLNVPIRGDFEVRCELAGVGASQMKLCYAGLAASLSDGGEHVELTHFGRQPRSVPLEPPLRAPAGAFYAYRLVVADATLTGYLGAVKIFERRLPIEPDPWLAFTMTPRSAAQVRSVVITGNATVPEVLQLSAGPDLTGWLAYDGVSKDDPNPHWVKRGDSICAGFSGAWPGVRDERLLQYHRPLLEDGEVSYEFFFQPGKVMTHPALGRLAFLLQPAGVKIHCVTDGNFERTSLLPENETVEPEHRLVDEKLPLLPNAWNRMKVKLQGNVATLSLNGTAVYRRAVASTNSRAFGLFHFRDETEVRVRNVTYRGDWPKSIPTVKTPALSIDVDVESSGN